MASASAYLKYHEISASGNGGEIQRNQGPVYRGSVGHLRRYTGFRQGNCDKRCLLWGQEQRCAAIPTDRETGNDTEY